MLFFKKKKKEITKIQWKITKRCLDLILESAKESYPNEFGALLRVDLEKKDTIIELILLPGTISGNSHAIFRLHMQPIDFSIVGTVHSHPSPYPHPSEADLQLFRKHGKVHIIAASPFNHNSWKSYNYSGDEIEIKVV
jgi:proteasome lid subunit RPN8/RPN11